LAREETVRVEGLRELQRAFKLADAEQHKQLRATLKTVAEPVRVDAEILAVDRIRRIGIPWSRMRVGITQTSVYVAPEMRGRRSRSNRAIRRPNLKPLLLDEAMIPALNSNTPKIVAAFERALGEIGKKWEQA
jgi:hypothetical protein